MKSGLLILLAWCALTSVCLAAEIRYLKLNDNAASTTVVATTGANGTLGGGDNTSVVQTSSGPGGSINYAFNLNGTDDSVSLGAADVYSFGATSAWSISFWFNADTLARTMVGRAGSGFRGITITSATTIEAAFSSGGGNFTVPTMSTGTWYHVFITRTTGQVCRLWLNGVEASNQLTGTAIMTFDSIGRRSSTYFDGRITQFRVFDSDESANVATYYAEGVSSSPKISPALLNVVLQ